MIVSSEKRKKKRGVAASNSTIPAIHPWIAVDVKLPPYKQDVLVTCGREIGLCHLSHVDQEGPHFFVTGGTADDEFFDVVGWRVPPAIPDWAKQLMRKREAKGNRGGRGKRR